MEDPNFGKYESTPNQVDQWLIDAGLSELVNAHQLDDLVYNAPHLLSVWSAGNDRNDGFQDLKGDGRYVTFRSGGPNGPEFYVITALGPPPPANDGNSGSGFDSLHQTSVAKNNLTVGAILDVTDDPYDTGTY